MYIDWLSMYQDYPGETLPIIGDEIVVYSDIDSGEVKRESIKPTQKRGSFDSGVVVRCDGNRVTMSGNPSRWGQKDSLFGITSMAQAVAVFNSILDELGLPRFTKDSLVKYQGCREKLRKGDLAAVSVRQSQSSDNVLTDGAVITRVDICVNYETGSKLDGYRLIEYLASQRHQGQTGFVYPNGATVDWKGRSRKSGSRYVYFKYYLKCAELGCDKSDPDYYDKLHKYAEQTGMMRFEISLKSMFLKKRSLHSINNWKNVNLNELIGGYMMHKQSDFSAHHHSDVGTILLGLGESRQIAARAQGLVDSWAAGNMYYMDNRIMSQATRYRYRNLIKGACGVDILEAMNVVRMPIRVRTIELKEASPPAWYMRLAS